MAGEISIDQMFGVQKSQAPSSSSDVGGALSVSEMFGSKGATIGKTPLPSSGAEVVKAVEGMGEDSFLNRSLKALWSAQLYSATNPEKAMSGGVKAVAGGAVSLGDLAAQGLSGIATWMTGKTFAKGQEASSNFVNNVRDVSALITGVNLSPEGKEEEAMSKLLGILPDAITSTGDTVFEKTGSALAGAGSQALLTLLTLKPGVVSKALRRTTADVPKAGKPAPTPKMQPKIEATFDELASTQPTQAREIARHVGEADPKLQEYLEAKIKQYQKASDEDLIAAGQAQARAKILSETGGNEQLGLSLQSKETQLGFPIIRDPQQLSLDVKGGEARKSQSPSIQAEMDLPAQPQQLKLLKDDKNIAHSVDNTGEHRIESENGELLAQEHDNKLQIKRIDVKAEAKGKGEGVAMMMRALKEAEKLKVPLSSDVIVSPDAVRLYEALKKRGFEVRENPHEVSKTTKNLVSKDPRKGVFEVRLKREPVQTEAEGLYKPPGEQGSLKLQRPLDEQIGLDVNRPQSKRDVAQQRRLNLPGEAPRQLPLLSTDRISSGLADTIRDAHAELEKIGLENRTAPAPEKLGTETLRRDLPPVAQGRTRVFIVNKPGDRGQAVMTLKEAETLGVPLASTYRGKTAYVDVLTEDLPKFKDRNGKIVKLPGQLAAKARAVNSVHPTQAYQHKADPVLFTDNGKPVNKSTVQGAFTIGKAIDKIPALQILRGKLSEYYEQAIRTVNPEALGQEAKVGAAVLAKNIAEQMQKDSSYLHRSEARRSFWNHRADDAPAFIRGFEKGERFEDPLLNNASEAYRAWNKEIASKEESLGLEYEAVDNYLYHLFENSPEVADFFTRRFGPKWNNPKFIKDRSFDLYEEAIEAGFKPRFTNPEDIMLARQHASDVAEMRIQTLRDLESYGMAKKITDKEKGRPEDFPSTEWRSPNGDRYWVHNNASAVLYNAFNTKSLWNMRGIGGDAFRGAMALKNTIVPIKLAFSLFHPLHVLTIDNATGMVRASKELLSGKMNPARWMAEMGKAAIYKGIIDNPRSGSRLLRAYQGKVAERDLTAVDRQALQYMAEGGMIPEMSSQYKNGAITKFKDAIQKRSITAAFHAPFAAIELMGMPMFQIWIPSLKIASYLKDVQTAMRTDPSLIEKPMERQLAFRKISKSIDNRYGEMAYNTLFWNRWVKDLAVANTLSLGWQMGFIREYGGGMLDLGQFAKGGQLQKVKTGMLDRPLFVTFYTAQALAYGGLMTWALSGKSPENLLDYIYPKNGEKNKDDTDQRVSTMFYPREFMAIYKHMENEGVVSGLGHLASSKASGVLGLTNEWASGVNAFGQEIADPDAPMYKQLEQKLAYTLSDLTPISISAIREQASENPLKTGVMNVAGFSPAPKYITESGTQAEIKRLYLKYYAPKQTPYEKARYSDDARKLRTMYDSNDMEGYSELLDKVREKYDLTAKDEMRLQQNLMRGTDPSLSMFKHLTWQQQKKVLDAMSEDERATYLPLANKEHLRYGYEPPESK